MATPATCTFFLAGKCRNGDQCKFAHTKPGPKPCKFYLQNACTAGAACPYSHDVPQELLKKTSAGETKPAPGSFGTRCKFYANGTCTTGAACPYLHVDGQQSGSESGSGGKPRARKPTSTVKMHVLSHKKKGAESPTQTEGEATQQYPWAKLEEPQQQEDGGDSPAKLSDFLTKEEELYYYGAPGEFDDAQVSPDAMEGKVSYAEIAARNIAESNLEQYIQSIEGTGAPPQPCTFFMQGHCRFGDKCFYSHSLEKTPETDEERALVDKELAESAALECGICYDLILVKGERFGLLSGCTHAFCLPCVRNWRASADQPKQTVRMCPVCRVETAFVVPSNRMITDTQRKKKLVREYTSNLSRIPCRHFDEGRGECPFGTSCFYAHRYPTGEEASREVRTALDAEGQYDVLRSMRLNAFFDQLDLK